MRSNVMYNTIDLCDGATSSKGKYYFTDDNLYITSFTCYIGIYMDISLFKHLLSEDNFYIEREI